MDWYYVEGGQRIGPVNEAELGRLEREGRIKLTTLVWHEGMADWQPYGEAKQRSDAAAPTPAGTMATFGQYVCAECGRTFSQDDMIRYGEQWVCAQCKPLFVQKLKEGAPFVGALVYAGFWIRFGAKFIDGIILGVIGRAIGFVVGPAATGSEYLDPALIGAYLLSFAVGVTYTTWFLGRFGATPGKMACGLKVITADGGKVSYARACGRHFAEMLSVLICYIGYIMAAFDDQKRTLHDRICNTRVVRK